MGDPERRRKRLTALQVRILNPPIRAMAARGLAPGVALLETIGRTSGEPRRIPVSNGFEPETNSFWIIAEMGRKAAYVRNIEADPNVRVRVRGRWRAGAAHVSEGEDPLARLRSINRLNALAVKAMGSDLLVIRVDLDD